MRYVLTIEPKPGTDEIRALRAALKALGRCFGLRCVSIREMEQSPLDELMQQAKDDITAGWEPPKRAAIAKKQAPVRKSGRQPVA